LYADCRFIYDFAMRGFSFACLLLCSLTVLFVGERGAISQEKTAPVEGLRENNSGVHALRGATVWTQPSKKIENATILIREGKIAAIGGADLPVPPEARVWDASGKHIYAGFIDSASALGKSSGVSNHQTHWSSLVRPERRAAEFEPPEKDSVTALRKIGFTTAHLVHENGIFRGQSCAIQLGEQHSVLASDLYQCLAFETAGDSYPASLMGSVALTRQALYDAIWYRDRLVHWAQHPGSERPETNTALAALRPVIENAQPLLGKTRDELDYARFFAIADEFDLNVPVILGNGYEYRQANLLAESGATVIVPLNFPKAPPVENPEAAIELSLERLEHWERAPANAAALAERDIPICLTLRLLEKPGDNFWKQLRECLRHGLSADDALAALTTTPAAMMNLSDRLGSIAGGKIANLVVADGDLFDLADTGAAVHQTWIDGVPYETDAAKRIDVRGEWTLKWIGVESTTDRWRVGGKLKSPSLKVDEVDFSIKAEGERVWLFPTADFFGEQREGTARLSGFVDPETRSVSGAGHLPGGETFSWTATIASNPDKEKKADRDENQADDESEKDDSEDEDGGEKAERVELAEYSHYPAGAFGIRKAPAQPQLVLIQNATIWTSAEAGRLEKSDLLIRKGKIAKIGRKLPVPKGGKVVVIDAKGRHVTPGLIDCHSHSAISRGINEGSHAVTVEVRIGDVINPADIALYRELGGGLTTSNILHGSANPMGGQNQVIKLRWGSQTADGLRFDGAKPGVKFALGENVKQSNWDEPTNRYPQTRMGVEQIMKDTFLAAREYEKKRAAAAADADLEPQRRNLRLEAALEILNRERIIHIHSYRQDEILMFVRLAEEFDLEVGTFQHVLEGYKVADAIAGIGAGGSSFSDWWAYKFEVYDAIPYNGALLHQAGVVTSFNSDSNELATRLNTEAAKAVKYGGLSEEEALKFVTLNPAIQLRIDDRVGSLEVGKDADFVIWGDHPLSSYARAEQTWIDGRKYFDLESDEKMRTAAIAERERLIAKALPKRMKNLATQKAKKALDENADAVSSSAPEPKPKSERFPYLNRDWLRQCRSVELGLYHDGQNSHTCTTNCCGQR
jgi:imidazolonepropionase-like amidohydrolase